MRACVYAMRAVRLDDCYQQQGASHKKSQGAPLLPLLPRPLLCCIAPSFFVSVTTTTTTSDPFAVPLVLAGGTATNKVTPLTFFLFLPSTHPSPPIHTIFALQSRDTCRNAGCHPYCYSYKEAQDG